MHSRLQINRLALPSVAHTTASAETTARSYVSLEAESNSNEISEISALGFRSLMRSVTIRLFKRPTSERPAACRTTLPHSNLSLSATINFPTPQRARSHATTEPTLPSPMISTVFFCKASLSIRDPSRSLSLSKRLTRFTPRLPTPCFPTLSACPTKTADSSTQISRPTRRSSRCTIQKPFFESGLAKSYLSNASRASTASPNEVSPATPSLLPHSMSARIKATARPGWSKVRGSLRMKDTCIDRRALNQSEVPMSGKGIVERQSPLSDDRTGTSYLPSARDSPCLAILAT